MIRIWRPLFDKNEMLLDVRAWGVSECSGRPIFIYFIKENWICTVIRHHIEPNINMLLTRILAFDSEVRQWSHPLMIPLYCLRAKSNNRTRGQFECDVTWFSFCFDFVRSHEQWKEVKRKHRQRKRKPDNINELILKTKANLKGGPDNI